MKFLKLLWRKWKPIAHAIGDFQAQVILTIFYFVFFLPLGIIFAVIADPLRIHYSRAKKKRSNFVDWEHEKDNLATAHRQF
ncbi:MAG: hypothetical protein NUV69_03575 [Candidatus Curtissbacteria bacterium]|nr:hypothetical protein [Candidatus Curtissbacteria bacterium]